MLCSLHTLLRGGLNDNSGKKIERTLLSSYILVAKLYRSIEKLDLLTEITSILIDLSKKLAVGKHEIYIFASFLIVNLLWL